MAAPRPGGTGYRNGTGGIIANPGTFGGGGGGPIAPLPSYLSLGRSGGMPGGMDPYGAMQTGPNPRKRIPGAAPEPHGPRQPNPLDINIYEQYPGFEPLHMGDSLGFMGRRQGGTPNQLNRLSQATQAYRGMTPPQPQSSSSGYGDTGMLGPALRKLIMARLGGI